MKSTSVNGESDNTDTTNGKEPPPFFSDTSGQKKYDSVLGTTPSSAASKSDTPADEKRPVPFFTDESSGYADMTTKPSGAKDDSAGMELIYEALGMNKPSINGKTEIRPMENSGMLDTNPKRNDTEGIWEKETAKKLNNAIKARLEAEAILASIEEKSADSDSLSPTDAYSVLSNPATNSTCSSSPRSGSATSSFGMFGRNATAFFTKGSSQFKSDSPSATTDVKKTPFSGSTPAKKSSSSIPRRIFTPKEPSSSSSSTKSSVSLTDNQSVEERMVAGPGKAQAEWNEATTVNARRPTSAKSQSPSQPKSRPLTDKQSVEERMVEGPGKAQAEWNKATSMNSRTTASYSSIPSSSQPKSRSLTDMKSVEERMVENPGKMQDGWKQSTTVGGRRSSTLGPTPPVTGYQSISTKGRRDLSKKPDLKPIDIENVLFEVDDALKAAEDSLSGDDNK
jgi:hypothetical protein